MKGWQDPFSFDEIDDRQNEYVQRFGLQSSYTPQMVVDGATQFVGSNAAALEAALVHAAQTPKLELAIENARWDRRRGEFHGSALRPDRMRT